MSARSLSHHYIQDKHFFRVFHGVLEGELLQRYEKDEKEKYFHIVEHSSHLVFGFTDNKLCFSVVL